MSRKRLSELKRGDLVEGTVSEVLGEGFLIVSFEGELIRVRNQTGRRYQLGDRLQLVVQSGQPLSFQIPASSRGGVSRFV